MSYARVASLTFPSTHKKLIWFYYQPSYTVSGHNAEIATLSQCHQNTNYTVDSVAAVIITHSDQRSCGVIKHEQSRFRYKILLKIIWPSLCVRYFLVGCVWQVWGTLPLLPTLLRLRQSILTQPQHDQILFNAHTDQIISYLTILK